MHIVSHHKEASRARTIAITNQCPVCVFLYATVEVCKRHWERGVLAGQCSAQAGGSDFCVVASSRSQYLCRLCGAILASFASYNAHMLLVNFPEYKFGEWQGEEQLIDLDE